MPEYLLRIEPTNLGWFLGDTEDLSTIRGGSLLLLEVGKTLADHFTAARPDQLLVLGTELHMISAGASELALRICCDDSLVVRIEREILAFLNQHSVLRFATFASSLQPLDAPYQIVNERSKMQLRRKQLRQVTVSVARLEITNKAKAFAFREASERPCDFDNKRPSAISLIPPGKATAADKNNISVASYLRREAGRESKAAWANFVPAWTLEEIASLESEFVPQDSTQREKYGRLSGKMAVFYADGNKFGDLMRGLATSAEKFTELDKQMRDKRKLLNHSVADHIANGDHWRCIGLNGEGKSIEKRRAQTLLWGGDELIWVVPAWCGLEIAQLFFDISKDWQLEGNKLTHATGLVFCSHKAPIRAIVQLARELADLVKRSRGKLVESLDSPKKASTAPQHSPHANALAYVVLESFDHLGRDFQGARAVQRFPSLLDQDEILTATELNVLIKHCLKLKDRLPTRRLHQLAQTMYLPSHSDSTTDAYERLFERMVKTSGGDLTLELLKQEIRAGDHAVAAKWQHVLNLWDYCFDTSRNANDEEAVR